MSNYDFSTRVFELLGLDYEAVTMDEAIQYLEEILSIALTGELPERWTIVKGGKSETSVRNL